MFVVESSSARAARKMSVLMVIILLAITSLGVLLTMHFYTKPRGSVAPGLRFFGLPRPNKALAARTTKPR
jgi:hypothetical protein